MSDDLHKWDLRLPMPCITLPEEIDYLSVQGDDLIVFTGNRIAKFSMSQIEKEGRR